MMRTKIKRPPTSPGEILQEEFLRPLGMTQRDLARHVDCDVKVVNRIVNGRSSVTAEMALKLGAAFRTTPEFWLNAQKAIDLHRAASSAGNLPRPLHRALFAEAPKRRTLEDLRAGIGKHIKRKHARE